MDGRKDGWTDGRMDAWMDGQEEGGREGEQLTVRCSEGWATLSRALGLE